MSKGSNSGSGSKFEPPSRNSKLYGEADVGAKVDQTRVKELLDKMDKEEDPESKDGRKRKYNSLKTDVDVTEEEMEAYRIRKERGNDPMANISSEEILTYK